jgi:hypothetical protein
MPPRSRPKWVPHCPRFARPSANHRRALPGRPATSRKASQCTQSQIIAVSLLTWRRQTQSVTSSVLREFRYEDGRRYHVWRISLGRPALANRDPTHRPTSPIPTYSPTTRPSRTVWTCSTTCFGFPWKTRCIRPRFRGTSTYKSLMQAVERV